MQSSSIFSTVARSWPLLALLRQFLFSSSTVLNLYCDILVNPTISESELKLSAIAGPRPFKNNRIVVHDNFPEKINAKIRNIQVGISQN